MKGSKAVRSAIISGTPSGVRCRPDSLPAGSIPAAPTFRRPCHRLPRAGQTASKPLSPQGFSSLTVASSMVTLLPADDGK